MIFAVVGAGMQGTCAAWALRRMGAEEVRIVDVDKARATRAADRVRALAGGRVVAAAGDATRPETLRPSVRGTAAVLSCAPYALNPPLARTAVEEGVSYVDLGGNTTVSRVILGLGGAARRARVSVIPDCGLAPGLGTTLAAALTGRFPAARTVTVLCGGLPQHPEPPLYYHLVFSLAGLLNEYAGEAEIVEGGRVVRVPTLDPPRHHQLPGLGNLESCRTSGGIGTAAESFAGRLDQFEYRTLRWPGHWADVRAWDRVGLLETEPIDVGGQQIAPRDVLAALLGPRLTRPGARDLVALVAEAPGHGRFTLVDRHDEATGFTAMERCTAIPAATVTWMAAHGETRHGGARLEVDVPPERFLEHLSGWDLALTFEAA
jgi:lysine 6-dehydrogenase